MTIRRVFQPETAVILNGAAISGAIPFGAYAGGMIMVPSAWTAANIGFYVCDTVDGTYIILRDESGNPVQVSGILANGARAYNIPSQVFGANYTKLWSKSETAATETDTNQGADRVLTLMLKS